MKITEITAKLCLQKAVTQQQAKELAGLRAKINEAWLYLNSAGAPVAHRDAGEPERLTLAARIATVALERNKLRAKLEIAKTALQEIAKAEVIRKWTPMMGDVITAQHKEDAQLALARISGESENAG